MSAFSKEKKGYSISYRLMFFIIMIILMALALTCTYSIYVYQKSTQETAIKHAHDGLEPLTRQIEAVFNSMEVSVNSLWTHEDLQYLLQIPVKDWNENPRHILNINQHMAFLFSWQQGINGIYIITDDGGIIYDSSRTVLNREYNILSEPFFQKGREMTKPFIDGPHDSNYNLDGGQVFSLTRPLFEVPSIKWRGVIHIDINAEKVFRILRNVDQGNEANLLVVDDNKRIVYSRSSTLIGKDLSTTDYRLVSPSREKSKDLIQKIKIDNHSYYVFSEYSPVLNWTFYRLEPIGVTQIVVPKMIFLVIGIGLFSSLIIFLVGWRLLLQAFNPLTQLVHAFQRLGGGDFSSQIEPTRIKEMKPVVEQYNNLVNRLHHVTEHLYMEKLERQQTEIQNQKIKLQKREIEIRQKEAEKRQLEAQINPHFLYNTLSCIQSMAELDDNHRIERAVNLLSRHLRYSVSNEKHFVTLEEELIYVKVFTEIQKFRYNDKINFIYDVPRTLFPLKINRLLIQPVVENAYIHGIEGKIGKGNIFLKVSYTEPFLSIEVRDDGVGITQDKLQELKDFIQCHKKEDSLIPIVDSGLKNVIRRIYLTYGMSSEVQIESDKSKTVIQIRINLQRSFPYDKGDDY
ncbi:sensor histidine kinase [Neobacillus vireti]|uniref:sensor histidine kinase n=1 Tax=Neobacillus vireti TaxID=220686 RepID=UPI002FFDD133